MFCNQCGTENLDNTKFCSKCGNSLVEKSSVSLTERKNELGPFERLHIISEEIEKLDTFHKLGFYLQGFSILLIASIYTLFIAPILIYFLGGKGWPKNSLVKAVLYYFAYIIPIIVIIAIIMMFASMVAAFVFGMGSSL